MRVKPSQCEIALVGVSLISIAVLSGAELTDWTASLAVLLGFVHAQLSFDLAERRDTEVGVSRESEIINRLIFVSKESVWLLTFLLLDSYPLLFGAGMFLSYPVWRKWIRGAGSIDSGSIAV